MEGNLMNDCVYDDPIAATFRIWDQVNKLLGQSEQQSYDAK